jgi:GntR family transcriptional regulator
VTVSTDDPTPAYAQLVRHLREQIASGELRPGDRLPSHRELAASFGVSTNTVLTALRVLRDEGLVSGQQGRGTFVRTAVVRSPPSRDSSALEQIMSQLEEFQRDLREMRRRLERLESAADGLLAGEDHPAP